MRTLASRSAVAVIVLALAVGVLGPITSAPADDNPLAEMASFRPFPAHNTVQNGASVLDAKRRHWFFATRWSTDKSVDGKYHVWQFDPDGLKVVGKDLVLPGGPPFIYVLALDEASGLLLVPYKAGSGWSLAAVAAGPGGPTIVADRPITAVNSDTAGLSLEVRAAQVDQGRLYLLAKPDTGPPETVVVRVDVSRFLAGDGGTDWRYRSQNCATVASFAFGAVGKSHSGPRIFLPCASQLNRKDQLQGAVVIEMGSETAAPAAFIEKFYPVSGDFSSGDSFFDPATERLMMRRTGPAQLIVFDGANRRWMRPNVFGQNNLFQSALDPVSGRLYGLGDDPSGGQERLYLLAAEPRTTPPGNGISQLFLGAPDGYTTAPGTPISFDSPTKHLLVADYDVIVKPDGSGRNTVTPDGLYFRIFRDGRAPLTAATPADPDKAIINLSGEAQGYGARISYVGGAGGTYSNAGVGPYGGDQAGVAGGTRHLTFARTLRLRLTEGEASGEAIAAHPEGKTDAEMQANGQKWPYNSARCADFGDTPGENAQPGAKTHCEQAKRYSTSEATYQADGSNPFTNPVQQAKTSSSVAIDAVRGVVTTVTSEGSLDVPGIVHIGRATAVTQTWAAGADGKAGFAYKRTMEDVSVAGQPPCSTCDPEQVAKKINDAFANTASGGVMVVAEVPQPDQRLLASKGGAQAILQRDFWDHEQDTSLHDNADDRYEMPAFILTIYQDRSYPSHEVYSLAGVQAVSRLPRSLNKKLDELKSAPEAQQFTQLPAALTGPGVISSIPPKVLAAIYTPGTAGTPDAFVPGTPEVAPVPVSPAQLRKLVRHLRWGIAWPFSSPAVFGLWAFLSVPVFLASRRRLLLSRQAQRGVLS
jgi:hypothetical protein